MPDFNTASTTSRDTLVNVQLDNMYFYHPRMEYNGRLCSHRYLSVNTRGGGLPHLHPIILLTTGSVFFLARYPSPRQGVGVPLCQVGGAQSQTEGTPGYSGLGYSLGQGRTWVSCQDRTRVPPPRTG